MADVERPCKQRHEVNGVIPAKNQLEYDNRVCDCNRVIFIAEPACQCPGNTQKELREKPNNR